MKPPTRKHWIDDFSYKEGYADGYAHHKRESEKALSRLTQEIDEYKYVLESGYPHLKSKKLTEITEKELEKANKRIADLELKLSQAEQNGARQERERIKGLLEMLEKRVQVPYLVIDKLKAELMK